MIFPEDVLSTLTENEARKLYELAEGKVVLELGSWLGRSTIVLAQSAETVHACDHFLGDHQAGFGAVLSDFFQNIRRYGVFHKVIVHVGDFERVLPWLATSGFSLVFCDGLHTAEATELQLYWARKLCNPEGVICLHDYDPTLGEGYDVVGVVNDEFGEPDEVIDTLAVIYG